MAREDGTKIARDRRHASPIHLHLAREDKGGYLLRALGLLSAILPDIRACTDMIRTYLAHLQSDLTGRVTASGKAGKGRKR